MTLRRKKRDDQEPEPETSLETDFLLDRLSNVTGRLEGLVVQLEDQLQDLENRMDR